jgi:hypothetical protein
MVAGMVVGVNVSGGCVPPIAFFLLGVVVGVTTFVVTSPLLL